MRWSPSHSYLLPLSPFLRWAFTLATEPNNERQIHVLHISYNVIVDAVPTAGQSRKAGNRIPKRLLCDRRVAVESMSKQNQHKGGVNELALANVSHKELQSLLIENRRQSGDNAAAYPEYCDKRIPCVSRSVRIVRSTPNSSFGGYLPARHRCTASVRAFFE